ncbi:hypothetical protein B0H14DRAFT_2645980 [Mycena olivaceomarginata]|nr:hypothetical protein B0H14DRAFT_2645980 [Mycena olivaceomarginata]
MCDTVSGCHVIKSTGARVRGLDKFKSTVKGDGTQRHIGNMRRKIVVCQHLSLSSAPNNNVYVHLEEITTRTGPISGKQLQIPGPWRLDQVFICLSPFHVPCAANRCKRLRACSNDDTPSKYLPKLLSAHFQNAALESIRLIDTALNFQVRQLASLLWNDIWLVSHVPVETEVLPTKPKPRLDKPSQVKSTALGGLRLGLGVAEAQAKGSSRGLEGAKWHHNSGVKCDNSLMDSIIDQHNSTQCCCIHWGGNTRKPWLKPKPSQAKPSSTAWALGLGLRKVKPKPGASKPKPGFPGQAKP